ncbi:hypothetical protein MUP77_00365 [Candidatus Bathyarchaeota archaeon]|nr:hypothetical protein [Candidatus Bathyarchaeota archaeon]
MKKKATYLFFPAITLIMLSKEYLAGLIDGEGYIGIIKTRRPKWKGRINIELTPRVQINMTRAHTLLEEIKKECHGRLYLKTWLNVPSHWHSTENLYIEGKENVSRLLNDILPHLRLKNKQATLVLEYYKYASPHGIDSENNLPHQFRIYNELRKLNWRGKGEAPTLRLEDHVRPRMKTGPKKERG